MTSTRSRSPRSASAPNWPRRSASWTRLCAETLAGIADPLFPALTLARSVAPAEAARAVMAGLLGPVETPAADAAPPPWLLRHQADAVRRAAAILDRFGGVLVADGVGLGKTFVGLGLIELERRRGGDAVAIVPAALRAEWSRAAEELGARIDLCSHTRLARRPPELPSGCSLLVVDEAHAFRHPWTRRYRALAALAVGRRLALLTATPVNNSLADLSALIRLFAGRDRFREFGVSDLPAALARGSARCALALAAITVCRSRRLVEQLDPALAARFPLRRLAPPVRYDLDAEYDFRLAALLAALDPLRAAGGAAEGAFALLYLGLLRRLESSRYALRRSLLRHQQFLEQRHAADAEARALSRRDFGKLFPRGDADDLQLVFLPLVAGAGAGGREDALAGWGRAVGDALAIVQRAQDAADVKLGALRTLLDGELRGRKTIVFTEYRDTARWLARRLSGGRRVLLVEGTGAAAGASRITRQQALDAFSPVSRGRPADELLAAEVLVTTDVASEGMNLQDACAVVNYDLPWNPVRVMQRIGRVDRLDALHPEVTLHHLLADRGLEPLTGVLRRLRAKLEGQARTLASEPDPLAALWWVERGVPTPEAVERESWRMVEPFEARERLRAQLGAAVPLHPAPRPAPLIAAGIAAGDADPGAGILLALEWPDGPRVPLGFVVGPGGVVREDPEALARKAAQALAAQPIPLAPADLTVALATVLPLARERLTELSAARHLGPPSGAGREAALALLERITHHALRYRRPAAAALDGRLLALLAGDLPVGLDLAVGALAAECRDDASFPARLLDLLSRAAPPPAPALTGAPRIVLVAALVVAASCPSRPW